MSGWDEDQLELIHKLERLAGYVGKEADDDFRDLIADVQDEFTNIKRAYAREDEIEDSRLTAADVLAFGAEFGKDFPDAQKGCEVFVSVCFTEKWASAASN